VIAQSFSRIHWQNLINYGVLPLTFTDQTDYDSIEPADVLHLSDLRAGLQQGGPLTVTNQRDGREFAVEHKLSPRHIEMVLAGGQIPLLSRT
jgi:aconitate hydratase